MFDFSKRKKHFYILKDIFIISTFTIKSFSWNILHGTTDANIELKIQNTTIILYISSGEPLVFLQKCIYKNAEVNIIVDPLNFFQLSTEQDTVAQWQPNLPN